MTTLSLVPPNHIFPIPPSVAICPYCGGALSVQCEEWTQNDDGSWGVEEGIIHADCMREPEQTYNKMWRDWFRQHSYMPYVYQLPVDIKVAKWINQNFRFDMEK